MNLLQTPKYYLSVLVGDSSFHGRGPLTYVYDFNVPVGGLVEVPLKEKRVLGVVVSTTSKRPSIAVKPIIGRFDCPPLPAQLISLHYWMQGYYPAPIGAITQLFLPKKVAKNEPSNVITDYTRTTKLPPLTGEQTLAFGAINSPGLHILHGETGTGKTRVYCELIAKQASLGRSSIILTPEIGLTSQLVSNLIEAFGPNKVVLVHSGLTSKQRQQTWMQIISKKGPTIVIGPRSALFSPLVDVGLIVVDESHETAYKQDQAPHYHASAVAAKLAQLHKATLVLGSATPLVTDFAIAQAKNRPIVRMEQLATASYKGSSKINLIDMREKNNFSKSTLLSNRLIESMEQCLKTNEQILLFLNRRGTARLIFCEHCGWQALCPRCDIPLIYHGDLHVVRCHVCDHKSSCPPSCPECGNASIVFKGFGTKTIVNEVRRLFPNASFRRFDNDNSKTERIEAHYNDLRSGKVQIIVGTQTVAKGLDLPKLGLVGVIMADSGLAFPDFSAQERTYQLIRQVIGRVGRGHRSSQVIIQSYSPQSALLQSAINKDWKSFYENELNERKQFKFPPFYYLLRVVSKRATAKGAQTASASIAKLVLVKHKDVIVEGPAPAFQERAAGRYQWNVIIKARRRNQLLSVIKDLPTNCSFEIDPINLM